VSEDFEHGRRYGSVRAFNPFFQLAQNLTQNPSDTTG
jgi:hypothetical protein